MAFGLIAFMHVVFGELIPKTFAPQSPDMTSRGVAGPDLRRRPVVAHAHGEGDLRPVVPTGYKTPTATRP